MAAHEKAPPATTGEAGTAFLDRNRFHNPSPQNLASDYDADRFKAIEEFADKVASYWRSIGEAAYRADLRTIESHCQQVRVLTLAAFATVKKLAARAAGRAA